MDENDIRPNDSAIRGIVIAALPSAVIWVLVGGVAWKVVAG